MSEVPLYPAVWLGELGGGSSSPRAGLGIVDCKAGHPVQIEHPSTSNCILRPRLLGQSAAHGNYISHNVFLN